VTELASDRVIASFDSATVLRAANVAALKGQTFPYLGASRLAGAAVRVGAQLPWPVLRRLYAQIGASEGVRPDQLGRVDLRAVARLLTKDYPCRGYPAVMIGSTNGAILHLAAAMQVPWLPGTVLLPVKRTGDPQRPVDAMRFGRSVADELLDRNQEVVLHHMHDQVQDQLMVARMTYFRIKWRRLPEPYNEFLGAALPPGAPVILVEDESSWPVVRLGERHVFQAGAQGGLDPKGYLHKPHTPPLNDRRPKRNGVPIRASARRWRTGHSLGAIRWYGFASRDRRRRLTRWQRCFGRGQLSGVERRTRSSCRPSPCSIRGGPSTRASCRSGPSSRYGPQCKLWTTTWRAARATTTSISCRSNTGSIPRASRLLRPGRPRSAGTGPLRTSSASTLIVFRTTSACWAVTARL
jgi:hypothetical protein